MTQNERIERFRNLTQLEPSQIYETLLFSLGGIQYIERYPDEARVVIKDKERAEELSALILTLKPDTKEHSMKGHIYGPFYRESLGDYYEVSI